MIEQTSGPIDIQEENQFWLSIFRDHAQFFTDSLVPGETALIAQAQQYYQVFNRLFSEAATRTDPQFLQEAAQAVEMFRDYKLCIVNLQLAGQNPVNLPPGALQEMLDEDNAYLQILTDPNPNPNPAGYLLEQHLMWLPNNAAHAGLARNQLDPSEATWFKTFNHFQKSYHNLQLKTEELDHLMPDEPMLAPALIYLTRESASLTGEWAENLLQFRDLRATAQVLSISPPLLVEHFIREAQYYLGKLAVIN
jgi:hypothetical protein